MPRRMSSKQLPNACASLYMRSTLKERLGLPVGDLVGEILQIPGIEDPKTHEANASYQRQSESKPTWPGHVHLHTNLANPCAYAETAQNRPPLIYCSGLNNSLYSRPRFFINVQLYSKYKSNRSSHGIGNGLSS